MKMYIETTDDGFSAQLKNFSDKISSYATTLGLADAEVQGVKKDATLFAYVMGGMYAYRSTALNYTAYKDLLRYGGDGTLGALPVAPTLPTPAPSVTTANVQARFSALVQKCMLSPNFTEAIGQDLGILGSNTPFNPQDGKPTFKIEFSSGGHPNLVWKKGKFQGVDIHKSLDGVNFTRLDKDFSPDFIDKTELPDAGKSAVWYYKMIYLYKDEIVGNWSDVASVTVSG